MRAKAGRIVMIVAFFGLVFSLSMSAKIFFLALFVGGLVLVASTQVMIAVERVGVNPTLTEQFDGFNRMTDPAESLEQFDETRSALDDAADALDTLAETTRYWLPQESRTEIEDMRFQCRAMQARLYDLEPTPKPE